MPNMFSWYIDNNIYPSKEFVEKIIGYSIEASATNKTVTEINKLHNPNKGNPAAAATAARDFGVLNGELLSDDALMFEKGFYDYENLIFACISKRNVSKWDDIKIKPLVLICLVFSKMRCMGIDPQEILLTTSECYKYLSVLDDYQGVTEELIKEIVNNREYLQLPKRIPKKCIDVPNEVAISEIFYMLVSSKVFMAGEEKTIIKVNPLYWELIDYIASQGSTISFSPTATRRNNQELYDYYSNIKNGIMEIIPDIKFKKDPPKNATKDLFEYLFGIDRHKIRNWEEYLEEDYFGIYRIFYPIRRIALAKVYLSSSVIAERLVDYSALCKPYIEALKEGKLMIKEPFLSGHSPIEELKDEVNYQTGAVLPNVSWNRIVFGAPGTGKSYTLETDKKLFLDAGGTFERVTFHPDYSYSQFVGTYKPQMNSPEELVYSFVPGPFMRTLVRALKSGMTSQPKPHLLIIEEINRSNISAVFGDVFQLLDRENGVSQYPIHVSQDVKKHLKYELGLDIESIRIPDNMYIWATMNSADQGVFPMDTAFKRRWSFEYIGIDDGEDKISSYKYTIGGQEVVWNSLRKAINNWMTTENINEDKQLGPFFISKQYLDTIDSLNENEKSRAFMNMFKDKVLMYLFEDACRSKRDRLFANIEEDKNYKKKYSAICYYFEQKGINIFNQDIKDKYKELPL